MGPMGQWEGQFTNFSFLYDFFYMFFFLFSVKLSECCIPQSHSVPFPSIIFLLTTKLNI